ncbi:hypothetical protein T4C_4851 [Trichinella pseudospiralis]|uniref:Uncharacterized protein n=1 Tax=Trichinella pseudospiralis TaxID=6337 RepID=A0A0V1K3R3_TRIPS|nr:hypothetical protein T4C_4851 [Trichinella pseudospiralis]
MDPVNRFILKLQQNPAFFEAFLRSMTESRFTNASTVDQSQKLSQKQVLADEKRMLSRLKEKTRELKQILTNDMFYSLQAAVNTYDIFHFCNWYGNSTRGFSQKDIQNVYDARRIVNAVVAIRMEKITSVKDKIRLLGILCRCGRKLVNLIRLFTSRIQMLHILQVSTCLCQALVIHDLILKYFDACRTSPFPEIILPDDILARFFQTVILDLKQKQLKISTMLERKLKKYFTCNMDKQAFQRIAGNHVATVNKAGHVYTLPGHRMDSLNCDSAVLAIFDQLKMIDYRLACLEVNCVILIVEIGMKLSNNKNKIAEKASQANLSAKGSDDNEELEELNQNMKSKKIKEFVNWISVKLSDDLLEQKVQKLVAYCDYLAEEFLENEK